MYSLHKSKSKQAIRRTSRGRPEQQTFSGALVTLVAAAMLIGFRLFGPAESSREIRIAPPVPRNLPVFKSDAHNLPVLDASSPLVGIVSGHKGYDPGAVCPDGLTEAQVNYMVALEVTELLARRGVRTDLLEEFDDRLTDYQAAALVSIHADSCTIPGASGFKVARVTDSAIPEAEDKLVACLNQEYAIYTNLPQHPGSITDNMTNYHAFNEIAPLTPGAIIEIGFLLDDRYLLEYKPKVLARGIAAGILCFLEQQPEAN